MIVHPTYHVASFEPSASIDCILRLRGSRKNKFSRDRFRVSTVSRVVCIRFVVLRWQMYAAKILK